MSYLPLSPTRLRAKINAVTKLLRGSGLDFDSIVIRGLSGAVIGPAVAARLRKRLVIIRKGTEWSHGSPVEREFGFAPKRYVIIDDFIDTGDTLTAILTKMKESFANAQCVGIALYNDEGRDRTEFKSIPILHTPHP